MAGFPLTAWALRHPWGADADAMLDALRRDPAPSSESPGDAATIATALLDELSPRCAEACARWGTTRVAVILGSSAPTTPEPLARLSEMLARVRTRTGILGPAYHVAATGAGGAKALASAERLLRASLADAVLVGGIDDDHGALLLLEKHGDAFVRLVASGESMGTTDEHSFDDAAAKRALLATWHVAGRVPLGYVHLHAGPDAPRHDAAERRMAEAIVGVVPCCPVASPMRSEGAAAGAIDAALAAASLVRGFTPEATPRELEHDRVLLHAFSYGGHHVGLLLEARA